MFNRMFGRARSYPMEIFLYYKNLGKLYSDLNDGSALGDGSRESY